MARSGMKKKRSTAGAVKMVDASVLQKLREEAEEQLEADRRQKREGKKARRRPQEEPETSEASDEDVSMEEQEEVDLDDRDLLAAAAAGSELKAIQERQAKYFPNNTAAMDQALELMEFKAPGGSAEVPWVESLSLTSSFSHEEVDATDDFTRELSFYRQAVDCCEQAAELFEEHGLRYKRPEDYFAEMLKTDAHMTKVRKSLLEQRQRIEAVEERRQQREMKKFGKQVQVAKEQARAKQRKQETEAIKKWRTTQKDADGVNVERTKEEFDVMLDATAPEKEEKKTPAEVAAAAPSSTAKKGEPQQPRVNLKRKRKDEKYGFGGKKRRIKSNTRDSTDSATEWSRSKNNSVDKDILRLVPKVGNQRAKKEQMLQRQKKSGKRR